MESYMEEKKQISEAAKELSKLGASKGGVARAQKLSPEERSEIARQAVEARWEKAGKNRSGQHILKATHQGVLKIGDRELICAVLDDGTRIISKSAIFRAFGRTKRGRKRDDIRVLNMPAFIDANNIQPFIHEDLRGVLKPIEYKNLNGQITQGYDANILPLMCDVYLEARNKGVLAKQQQQLAVASEILVRSFAKIGIIALIDEATGYQEIRDRIALQKILDKYLTDEWAKWTKTFPDDYYRELFRLKNISYPPVPSSTKKPSYVGHWTNDIIYSRLAPKVLEALKEKNPRLSTGFRARKHHQYLTREYGHPELTDLLSNVIFLMRTCSEWNDFKIRLDKAKPKYGNTLLLDY